MTAEVLQAVSSLLAGTRQNPVTRFCCSPIIAVRLPFTLISAYSTLHSVPPLPCQPLRDIYPCHSCASSCRPPSRDPVLWSCPPLNRPPLALSTGASVVRHILVDFYTCKTRGLSTIRSFESQERGGFENRARSRPAVLISSVAPGALFKRYVAGSSTFTHIFFLALS